jgi:hypothetical protein
MRDSAMKIQAVLLVPSLSLTARLRTAVLLLSPSGPNGMQFLHLVNALMGQPLQIGQMHWLEDSGWWEQAMISMYPYVSSLTDSLAIFSRTDVSLAASMEEPGGGMKVIWVHVGMVAVSGFINELDQGP